MGTCKRRRGNPTAIVLGLLLAAASSRGERLEVSVDHDGEPVRDAVVYAIPLDGNGKPLPLPDAVVIDQVDKEYVPYVTVVPVGTSVSFPNSDQIRHHVYSFSDAKQFEIPLYEGTPATPVVFDQSGTVALGCNIHDWMRAYVFVTETPYFAVTRDDGSASVDLPAGDYAVRVWHPELKGAPEATNQNVSVAGGESSLGFSIEQKRVWRPRRAPSGGEERYR